MAESLQTTRPFVVLIANDQEWSARSIESILSPQGYTVIRAYTGQQALERASTARPDLIILDAQLPDLHGLEVCKQLRADPRFGRLTPIVITTAGPSGRAQRVAAYEAGAWEFYGQPLDGEALLARLRTYLDAKLEADALRQAAMVDASVGLYTVRGLARRMGEIGSEMSRAGRPLACIAMRLPADVPGENPPSLGKLLLEHGRASDAIGHLGMEEYIVVAPDTARDGALQLVDRLERALRSAGFQNLKIAAGYSAIADFRAAMVEPATVLDQATAALRYLLGNPGSSTRLAFEDIPSGVLST